MKESLMTSRKWRATLLGVVLIIGSFCLVAFLLDEKKLSYNGQLTTLYGLAVAAVVSILTAFIALKVYSERGGGDK